MDSSSRLSSVSFSSSVEDSTSEQDANITLSDRLKVFKTNNFDPNAYVTSKCQTMNEKEIRHLFSYLIDLRKASAEEMRRSVYANYAAFIRTSREISNLEGQLLSMRNLLSTRAALVHGLAEGVHIYSVSSGPEDSAAEDVLNENEELSKMENWLIEFLDMLEVLLAERRVNEALAALDEAETVAEEASEKQTLSQTTLLSLQTAIIENRLKLADQLAETICQPSTRGVELRTAVLALKRLGDGPRAHTLLLDCHQQKLQGNMHSLRPSHASYGAAYTVTLSQLVFSTIAQAAKDSFSLFADESAYASELVTWAVRQTEAFGLLLKRHVLASSAAAGGLRVTAECFHVCLAHCSLLEARGLALSLVLLKLFRPCIEQALDANLKRIEQSSAALVASEDWLLAYPATGTRLVSTTCLGGANASQPKLSSSAQRFNAMVQDFFTDVGPLESLQLDGETLEGVLRVFNSYVNSLINALPITMDSEENPEGSDKKIVKMAESEAQQIALLANASLLADELLPRAAMKLLTLQQTNRSTDEPPRPSSNRQSRLPEQREWKKRLQRSVDCLRDNLCRQLALDLIFTEDGDTSLNAQIYINMDGAEDEPECFPSPIFQELFTKLTRMAGIAADMFVGRERSATILLMRFTETVVLWLSEDQTFWEDIEEGPKPLGPLGLQQLYLDMEFVILFSSQGRYLSRHLQQVSKNIIARAIDAVAATGLDPYSVLPEDDWFAEVAQIAVKMLSGRANFGNNIDRDVMNSPTASVSAKSALSFGSN